MKDAVGITRQYCTVRGVSKEQLENTNSESFEISHIEETDKDLRRGDLVGNVFCIKIRDIQVGNYR